MFFLGYLLAFVLILGLGFIVFRIIVLREYRRRGRLGLLFSMLELLVWCLFFCFPFLYSEPGWGWFWSSSASIGSTRWGIGMLVVSAGFVIAFGTMFWFGMRRAFGVQVDQLVKSGLYRISRNPQIVGGFLLVLGSCLIWLSWYNLGWILLYTVIAHMMVVTEEEHLGRVFGAEYDDYCQEVPRYLFFI
jgi:protein-S-isoprenylcysteine O-methyltransferase Ste14